MKTTTLTLNEIYTLHYELGGNGQNVKGLLSQDVSLIQKARLLELLKTTGEHVKTLNDLESEIIKRHGQSREDGEYFIPKLIEDKENPAFTEYRREFEAVLNDTRDITHHDFKIDQFDIKTNEVYAVFLTKIISE